MAALFSGMAGPGLRCQAAPGARNLRQPIISRSFSSLPAPRPAVNPLQAAPLGNFGHSGLHRVTRRRQQPAPEAPKAEAAAAASITADGGSDETKPGFMGIAPLTWQKILPLGFMFFCILFNYTILRDTKDVLVVTAPGSGAEVIPFLKTWVNLPMAIGFTVLYAKLANVLSTEGLFYACIIPFIVFFGSFAFLLYPLRDIIHPTAFCEKLLGQLGSKAAAPIAILRNWSFCLFYVMAELWGSVVVSLLFWGFANQITTVDEAKQFYPIFGLGANVALVFSGRAVKYFSQVRAKLPPGVDGWGYSLKGLMGMVVIGGLLITGTYFMVQRVVVPKVQAGQPKKKKEKMTMGVGESFKFLAASPYIRDLALLVVSYGISINLVEVTWKSKIKQQFPNPNDYSAFMGDFSSSTGAVTFLMMLLSRFIFRKFGWGVAALITPTVLLITGFAFFGLILGGDIFAPAIASLGLTPLFAAVLVGAAQNVFSKSAKYSLFDPCKEMAYIPLDKETQTKGKAAIDVVCNPLGKSGGSLIQQVMIVAFGSLATSTPYLGAILFGIVVTWMFAARSLNKQFTELNKQDQLARLSEAKAAAGLPLKKFKFVSAVNEQGFIEGKYVPLGEGESVTASMEIIEAESAESAASIKKAAEEAAKSA